MADDQMNPPPMGHNAGLVDPDVLQHLKARVAEFHRAAKAWAATTLTNAEDAEECAKFLEGCRALYKAVDTARKEAKAPHDERAKAVQEVFKPLLDLVTTSGDIAKKLHTTYLAAEQKRIDEEKSREAEAARKAAAEAQARAQAAAEVGDDLAAAEAEQAAKKAAKEAAKADKGGRAKATGVGRSVSLREIRSARVTKPARAILALLPHYEEEITDFLSTLATRLVRADKEITDLPGCEINTETKAQ